MSSNLRGVNGNGNTSGDAVLYKGGNNYFSIFVKMISTGVSGRTHQKQN
ncbi:MAG: hypothetical protein RG741_02325 [Bacteroidales bacterium]|nr:hypothetical protein [Bacteroidales bacterium]